jgi:hypothetical protein
LVTPPPRSSSSSLICDGAWFCELTGAATTADAAGKGLGDGHPFDRGLADKRQAGVRKVPALSDDQAEVEG